MKKWLLLWGLISVASVLAVTPPAELQEFRNCRFVPTDWADGDSFMVEIEPGREEVFRLYFVDCAETSATSETDQRRVRGQSAYFGLDSHRTTLKYGRLAAQEVAKLLQEPFTVHTAFSRALGRSAKPRYYAFVTLSDGRDLGEYLVANGFARSFGVGRKTKDGTDSNEAKEKMNDIELGAAIGHRGIWAHTNPEHIVSLRKSRRDEARELQEGFGLEEDEKLNPNTAEVEELILLPGMGPVLAERIVDGRPYANLEDLRKVKGFTKKKFDSLKKRWDF